MNLFIKTIFVKVKDVLMSSLRGGRDEDDLSDEGDW